MNKIASRYATALLELAIEENRLDFYCEQIEAVRKTLKDSPELLPFLSHYLISKEDKKEVIKKIFGADDNKSIQRFLYLIIEQGRGNILTQIFDDFLIKANQTRGVILGKIYSINPLPAKQIREIEVAIGAKLNQNIKLENELEPTLVSGVKVVVRDQVFDGSLKNRISMLKKSLLSRGG